MRRVLVTGAAGFIGSAFVRRLLQAEPGVRAWGLDNLGSAGGTLRNLDGVDGGRFRFVRGDICDARAVEDLLEGAGIDTVVHFAAESHVDRSIDGPMAFLRANVMGTGVLLEAARKAWARSAGPGGRRRFHQVSTDEVFGDRGDERNVADESTLRRPRSPYAASKAAADHLVEAWHQTWGLPVSTTYSSNNLGPRQHPEKLVPLVILRALAGEEVPLYGDGQQVRRWLHVDDHCDAILAVLRDDVGGDFAVGPDAGTANLDLVGRICALLDQRRPAGAPHLRHVRRVADRPGHDRVYHTSAAALRARLGWAPAHDLDQALAATVDWYLAHPAWVDAMLRRPAWARWLRRWYGVGGPG